jgi:hypothetical protein
MVSHVGGGCYRAFPAPQRQRVLYAEEQGWIRLEGAHRACLTEEGPRLIAREAY